MKTACLGVLAACLVGSSAHALADDVFVHVPLTQLEFANGKLPADDESWHWSDTLIPWIALGGPGEAYVAEGSRGDSNWQPSPFRRDNCVLVAKLPTDQPVSGTLFVPDEKWKHMVALKFTLKPTPSDSGKDFYHAKAEYYEQLQRTGAPGAAFFRREADLAHKAAGDDSDRRNPSWNSRPETDLEDTYDLFTGGRAVSENLQLARPLPPAPGQPAEEPDRLVETASIEGITVAEFDWSAKLGDAKPALDPLASLIPADQHAVFFPSFQALMSAADTVSGQGLAVYRGVRESSADGMLLERYERQLCLSRTTLARLLGPGLVQSVAITGGDPYFPTGTDVAVLFETSNPGALSTLLMGQVKLAQAASGAAGAAGDVGGVKYQGAVSDDRSVCSYVATCGGTVVVTNSLEQLKRLGAVQSGSASIAGLKDYAFFRNRYTRGEASETAFVFISDPTIRRWCSAQWRIAASRRLRALAIMSDVTAAHTDELVTGIKSAAPVTADTPMRTIGDLSLTPTGVRSSVYGGLSFMTPTAELDMKTVTEDEANAYKRWRDTYQRNWSWAFDPIAMSLSLTKDHVGADLSVLPLIMGSEYKTWSTVTQGAAIEPGAGDPHDALLHAVFAFNAQSVAAQQAAGFAVAMSQGVKIDPLGWIGQSIAVYADPDPFWDRLAAAEDPQKFFEKEGLQMPIALHAEVSSGVKLTAFLASVRALIEQSAPGMAAWETRTYHDQPYVCLGMSEKAKDQGGGEGFDKTKLYYAATPKALIVTLSEDLLKRAIDRQIERAKNPETAAAKPWLGKTLAFRARGEGLGLFRLFSQTTAQEEAQHAAWSNLPILNEWKRRYPDKDPVQVHQALWGVRLASPGGGGYVWNDDLRSMASTVYGQPADPKDGPAGADPLAGINAGDFGVTLQDGGLRAKAVVELQPRQTAKEEARSGQ